MDQTNIIEINDEQEENVPHQHISKENGEEKAEEEVVNQNEEADSEIPDIEEIEDSTPISKNSYISENFENFEKKKKDGITASVTYYPDFCINTIPKEEEEFTTHQSQYDVFSKINDDTTNKTIARKRKRDLLNCWNCGSTEHQVYNCPFHKNEATIEKNRKFFVESKEIKKTPLKSSLRYYEEEVISEKGFEQLVPGELLPELKLALGMSKNDEIPPYMNRFQIIGYPPAYIKNECHLNDYSDNDSDNDRIIIVEDEDDHIKVDLLDKQNEENDNNNDNNNEINNNENNGNSKITYKIHHFPRCTCNKELAVKYPSVSGNNNNNNDYYYTDIVITSSNNNCIKHYPLEFSSSVFEELINYSQSKLNNNNNNNNRRSSSSSYNNNNRHSYHHQQQYNNNIDIYNNNNNQYPLSQQPPIPPYYPPPNMPSNQLYNPSIQPQQYYNDYNYYPPQQPLAVQPPPPPLPPNYYYSNPPSSGGYENEQYTNYSNDYDNSHHRSHSRHGHSHSHSHHHHHSYRDDDDDGDERYSKRSRRDDY